MRGRMDDLTFVRERIPEYGDYSDETTRHLTDEYVRAYVGERLSDVRDRLDGELDPAARKTLEELLLRCQFTDQVFIRWIDHARLEAPAVAHLHQIDRTLVELADRVESAGAPEVGDIFHQMDIAFERRHECLPA
jgi:hypothetical protein